MAKPKLVQCLCPKRHCIIALAFREVDDDEHAIDAMRQVVQELLAAKDALNPYCGLCGANAETWACEVRALRADWDEAIVELKESERQQIATAEYLKTIGQAHERPRGMGSLN